MFKNTKEKRDPMEKAKQHLRDNFNKIIRERTLVIDCINDIIAEVENPLMCLLREDDRVKFLNNYHEINQQLETCLEKFFSIQIILSDYEEKIKDLECSKNDSFSNLTSSVDYIKNETENQLSDQNNQSNNSVQSEAIADGMNSLPIITMPAEISNEASPDISIYTTLPEKTFNNNELSFEMMINNSSEMIEKTSSEITKITSPDVAINIAKQKFENVSDIFHHQIILPELLSIENKNTENENRNQYNNLSNSQEEHENYSECELNKISTVKNTHNLLTNEETFSGFTSKSDDENAEKCFNHSSLSSSIPLLNSLDSLIGNNLEVSVKTNNYDNESLHSNKESLQTEIQNCQDLQNKLYSENIINEESLKNVAIDIPSCDVLLNESIPVNITYVENLTNFWLQPNVNQFNELLIHLQSFEETRYECTTIERKYFLAPYTKDEFLHRVKMLELLSENRMLVHYIDYGDKDTIPVSSLRPLPSSLSSIPSQAVLCFLDDIQPEEWVLHFFKHLILNQPLFAIISSPIEGRYPVKLFIKSSCKNDSSFEMIDIVQYILKQSKSELSSNVHKDILGSSNNSTNESVISSNTDSYQTFEDDKMKETENKNLLTNDTLISDTKESIILTKEAFLSENEMLEINYNCHKNWSLTIPEPIIEFIKDNVMIMMMSFIISPSEFYANIATQHCYLLDELEIRMNIFYNAYAIKHMIKNNIETKLINPGTFCSCKSNEDGKWYRARILETIYETKEIDEASKLSCSAIVQYIDYGNRENVPCINMLPLLPEFAKLPAFAVHCSLADIMPVEVENNNVNKWPKETIERFHELTGFKYAFNAQIEPFEENQKRFPLKIYIWKSETKSINHILVEEGLALGAGKLLNFNNGINEEIIENWDPMAADFLSERNSYKIDIDDPGVALTCYKAKDEKYVCKFFSRNGKCFRGERCPFKHIISKDETTLDKENVFSCDIDLDIPDTGKYVLVQISAVFNPSHFYVIFPYGPTSVDEIIFEYDDDDDSFNLESFISDMNKFYSKKRTSKDMTYEPLGKIVAAKSKLNGLWYRGRILNINEVENLYEIFFVDFGNCEWINQKDVEDIDEKFMDFPFQAIECHLANVNINNWKQNKYLEKQTWSLFRNLTEEKILVALILAKQDSVLYINLYTLDGIMLNKEFIDRGLFQHTSELF